MSKSGHALVSRHSDSEADSGSGSRETMQPSERAVMTGTILFAMGLVIGFAIGSGSAVSSLTQGAPDVLQSWSGVVALP